ncbi:hypothetical protein [Mycoplasma parvum]|uniref:Uncharacterized protein n=1 Tax=Mycoplasma parvum str. Indiana TaxID=1403316 RepID=U5NFI5_9MOLU|nr:hypothetical protein [Mycoplasma parvum]AGX88909.1 hypothetical protein PRV_00715 [Mycoplasma parvum str. Indiana]
MNISLKELVEEKYSKIRKELLFEIKEKILNKIGAKSRFNHYCRDLFNEIRYIIRGEFSPLIYEKITNIKEIHHILNSYHDFYKNSESKNIR